MADNTTATCGICTHSLVCQARRAVIDAINVVDIWRIKGDIYHPLGFKEIYKDVEIVLAANCICFQKREDG